MPKPKYKREYYYEDREVSKWLKSLSKEHKKSEMIREITKKLKDNSK